MWDDIMNNSDEHWGSKNKEKNAKKGYFLIFSLFSSLLFIIWNLGLEMGFRI
jgi:hypothetical protein